MLEKQEIWADILEDKDQLSIRELSTKYVVPVGAIADAFRRTNTSRTAVVPEKAKKKEAKKKSSGSKKGKKSSRSKDKVLEPFLDQLGSRPDSAIAEEAGVSARTVASFRSKRGIAAFTGKRGSRKRRSKVEPYRHLLGKVPDREVAEKAGVSLNTVRNYRVAEGIKPLGRSGAAKLARQKEKKTSVAAPAAKAIPAATRAVAPVAGDGAWRLVIGTRGGEEVRVVVGADIVAAARRAQAAAASLGGEVRNLSYIGAVV